MTVDKQKETKKVLFVCEGNSCRSIMAEALTKHYWVPKIRAYSAGIRPTGEVSQYAIEVLREIGVATVALSSKSLTSLDLKLFDLLVNLTQESMEGYLPPNFTGKVLNWYLRDPYRDSIQSFRRTRDALEWFVTELLPEYL